MSGKMERKRYRSASLPWKPSKRPKVDERLTPSLSKREIRTTRKRSLHVKNFRTKVIPDCLTETKEWVSKTLQARKCSLCEKQNWGDHEQIKDISEDIYILEDHLKNSRDANQFPVHFVSSDENGKPSTNGGFTRKIDIHILEQAQQELKGTHHQVQMNWIFEDELVTGRGWITFETNIRASLTMEDHHFDKGENFTCKFIKVKSSS